MVLINLSDPRLDQRVITEAIPEPVSQGRSGGVRPKRNETIAVLVSSPLLDLGTSAMEIGMTWLLILVVYAAPPGAADWNGPWELGMPHLVEREFQSEAECRNEAIQIIGRLHQGMLAPIRYHCVGVASGLPAGAQR